jgi:FRG domain
MLTDAIEIVRHDSSGLLLTADKFLEYLRPAHDRWHEIWSIDPLKRPMHDYRSEWVFRGHWNSKDWKLVAKIWRAGEMNVHIDKAMELDRRNGTSEDQIDRWVHWRRVEAELLYKFCDALFEFGYPVSKVARDEWHRADNLSPEQAEIVGLAQHHGVPTRFLDWSLNPFAAAYFAVANQFRTEDKTEEICVWCLNTSSPIVARNEDSFYSDETCLILRKQAPYSNPYLKAQKGLFTEVPPGQLNAGGESDIEALALKAFGLLSDAVKEESAPVLRKVVLLLSEVERLLVLLEREGYSRSLLMPTLDNLAADVMHKFLTRTQF